jgi:hypothetical protein
MTPLIDFLYTQARREVAQLAVALDHKTGVGGSGFDCRCGPIPSVHIQYP